MKKLKIVLLTMFLFSVSSWALGVSFPSAPVPTARFATGISYDYFGGYISADEHSQSLLKERNLPLSMHGTTAFFTYAPSTFVNIGVDMGLRNANISRTGELRPYPIPNPITGEIKVVNSQSLNGLMGLSAGPHIKLATPLLGDVLRFVATGRASWFHSEGSGRNRKWYIEYEYLTFEPGEDDDDPGKWVIVQDQFEFNWNNSGSILAGSAGLSFNVRNIGFISFGAKYLDIRGEIKATPHGLFENTKWENESKIGGWAAFDFFPPTNIGRYIPFISFEAGFFPNSNPFIGGNPALRNATFSVTIGAITRRLYGNTEEIWRP